MLRSMSPSLMHIGEHRPLTPGEIAIGQTIFGGAIHWPLVRALQAPPILFGAMVPIKRTIIFARWRAPRDFAAASLNEQGWFVHELAHVWQAARGRVLALSKLGALGKQAYAVKPCEGASLHDYNIEAQAEIARLLFLARAAAPELGSPQRDWLENIWRA